MAVTLDTIIVANRLDFTDTNWSGKGKPKNSTNSFSSDGTPYIAERLMDLYAFTLSIMNATGTAFNEELDYPGNSQILDAVNALVKTSIDGRNVFTTSPLLGGGPLDPDVTLSIQDGTVLQKGAVQLTNLFNGSDETLAVTQAGIQAFYIEFQGRTITAQSPLTGGGNLAADRTIGIQDATTGQKGAVQLTDDGSTPRSDVALTPQGLVDSLSPTGPLSDAFMLKDASNAENTTGAGALVFDGSPTLTGNPESPTPPTGDDSDRIATTAFVQDAIGGSGGSAEFLKQYSVQIFPETGVPSFGSTVYIEQPGGPEPQVRVWQPDGDTYQPNLPGATPMIIGAKLFGATSLFLAYRL